MITPLSLTLVLPNAAYHNDVDQPYLEITNESDNDDAMMLLSFA